MRCAARARQALIAQALEKVCTSNFENREDYYGGCLMYLIGKCLTPKTTSADVTRLHRVRHLLPELDWEHESIESLKLQLMRCVASPNFVRSTHGPDLVAMCFTIHPGFVGEAPLAQAQSCTMPRDVGRKSMVTARESSVPDHRFRSLMEPLHETALESGFVKNVGDVDGQFFRREVRAGGRVDWDGSGLWCERQAVFRSAIRQVRSSPCSHCTSQRGQSALAYTAGWGAKRRVLKGSYRPTRTASRYRLALAPLRCVSYVCMCGRATTWIGLHA